MTGKFIKRPRPELPTLPVRAFRQWVLIMAEPMETMLESGLLLVKGPYDENTDPGFAYVLSCDEDYWFLDPKDYGKKAPHTEDLTTQYKMPVRRGDKILFRRFMLTERLNQGKVELPPELAKQGYIACFIHVRDIFGIVEEE